jgi:DNA helicase-2/ATP-dependent DNA helicase PcrA
MTIERSSIDNGVEGRMARPLWQRCEQTFETWLKSQGYGVNPIANAVGNSVGTNAPMLSHGTRRYRAPDFDSVKGGVREYWEVKYRSRPHSNPVTGHTEHRVDRDCFDDYAAVQNIWGATVWIVVYEAATSNSPARWLRISLDDAARTGRVGVCPTSDDQMVESQLWPVEEMEVLSIPLIDETGVIAPIVSADEPMEQMPSARYSPFERRLRERARAISSGVALETTPLNPSVSPAERTLAIDPIAALDVLRRDLGITSLPRYSVLLVGGEGVDLQQVLGLLDYGIRLFLITKARDETVWNGLQHFVQARLLEWECVPTVGPDSAWVVDGNWKSSQDPWIESAAKDADKRGGVNLQQYHIVHAPADADVLVTAGAGTGKTETMTERLVYLLATVHGYSDAPARAGDPTTPRTISLDDVGLVTFTREAAKEMRRRIARTVTLRQRLCPRCVHPTAAWLMQLGRAQISTIHIFARGLVRQFGDAIEMGPNFSTSNRTLAIRARIRDELSKRLEPLYAMPNSRTVPPIHEWVRHVEAVWETLENNGVPLIALKPGTSAVNSIDWGESPAAGVATDAVLITGKVVEAVAKFLGDECRREQFLRTSQLVPAALEAVKSTDQAALAARKRRLRFLFVDEFQDTDSMQLDMLLAIRERLNARLFVVGDAKQGIYRFRGASGDAFDALTVRVKQRNLEPFTQFALTRNFRSDGRLLDSMHPYFAAWGDEKLLPYKSGERLLPRKDAIGLGHKLSTREVGSARECLSHAAQLVQRWRTEDPKASIAILCRRNSHAMAVQKLIVDNNGQCALLVGGTFFASEAVVELRALLEAVLDPTNTAALLELCETRWVAAILAGGTLWGADAEAEIWKGAIEVPMGWLDRFASLGKSDSFDRTDLAVLQQRVEFLSERLREMAAVAFIVDCHTRLDPSACSRSGDDDGRARAAYSRNLDHLITLIDAQFQNSAATAGAILEWLRIQIATNRSEDEPAERRVTEGETIALTVHKSKGLEFDRVIVPRTDTNFEASAFVTTEAFVTEQNGRNRVWWKWKIGENGAVLRNATDDQDGWIHDEDETIKEETRLLYVAMTRAKSHLTILRPVNQPQQLCWHGLLQFGEDD